MIPSQCPLQTKLMHTLTTPWIRFSTVEVVNRNPTFSGATFNFENIAGDGVTCVGGGILDSNGPDKTPSHFLASFFCEAFSHHDVLLKRHRRNDENDPLAALRTVMASVRRLQQNSTAVFTDEEFAQYARIADVELLKRSAANPNGADWACEAIWFAAQRQVGRGEIDVMVSNIGSCRGFGIPLNETSLSKCTRSALNPTRHPVVPLSMDHIPSRVSEFQRIIAAGGKVDGDVLDGRLTTSRGFGMRQYKSNNALPQLKQQVVAEPTTTSWIMRPGDMMILSNRGAFLTRSDEDLNVDDLGYVAMRGKRNRRSPAQIACDIADEAIVYGSPAGLQVLVVEALAPPMNLEAAQICAVKRDTSVLPGRLHIGALRAVPEYVKAFRADCARCGLDVPQFLDLRHQMLQEVDARVLLGGALSDGFGHEAGCLRRAIEEEMAFFEPLLACKTAASSKMQLEELAQALSVQQ